MRFGTVVPHANPNTTLEILANGLTAWVHPASTRADARSTACQNLPNNPGLTCGPVMQSATGQPWDYLGLSPSDASVLVRAQTPILVVASHEALRQFTVRGPNPGILCGALHRDEGCLRLQLHTTPEKYRHTAIIGAPECVPLTRHEIWWWVPLPSRTLG